MFFPLSQQILNFFSELPSSLRDSLTFQLCMFFPDEAESFFFHKHDSTSVKLQTQLLETVVMPTTDDFDNFYRGVLIISALDYIIARKFPWNLQLSGKVESAIIAHFPDELAKLVVTQIEYLTVSDKWKEFRSELTNRDLQEHEKFLYELGQPD